MFRIQLTALEHPSPNNIDFNDRTQFASTILWLEDQKVRHYKIEDREPLRQVGTTENWMADWERAYKQYKQDVNMPTMNSPVEELSWLLSYAVRLEFLDNVDKYTEITADKVLQSNRPAGPRITTTNTLDNLDVDELKLNVKELAQKLSIGEHPDHEVRLRAAARLIHEKLRPEALARPLPTGIAFPIKEGGKCAFDDPDVDQAAKILRLLQVHNVRALQTVINETIVMVQQITADPKTDTKLGKVGF